MMGLRNRGIRIWASGGIVEYVKIMYVSTRGAKVKGAGLEVGRRMKFFLKKRA